MDMGWGLVGTTGVGIAGVVGVVAAVRVVVYDVDGRSGAHWDTAEGRMAEKTARRKVEEMFLWVTDDRPSFGFE